MSEDKFSLSRRKALAALGTIGVASAGAGLGTSAYFSDQETFENNSLTAGTLDLGVGYSTHYSDWSSDEGNGVGDVQMYDGPAGATGGTGDLPSGYTGLPTNDAWLIAVPDEDVGTFLDNTQQASLTNDGCGEVGALTQADGESALINLGDVKPGDFGEVTFDLELCTNPGYVWMNNPGGYTANENGTTEPEADDPDEGEGVELMDVVQAAVWLDDGDNYQDGGESPLLVDSLRNVLDALNSGNGVRIDGQDLGPSDDGGPTDLTTFGVNRFDVDGDGTYGADMELVADPVDSGKVARATSGGSATADYVTSSVSLPADITISDVNSSGGLTYDYYEGVDNERAAPDEVILLLSDDTGTRRVVSRTWRDGDGASSSWATREVGLEITDDFGANSGRNWIEVTGPASTVNLGVNLTSDADISGSSEVLAMAVARGNSDPSVSRNLDVYYRDPTVQNGEYNLTFPTACFRGETDFSAAFAWWVPVDHGNEIQSDKVEFDLGFYTEQCRHNDGEGMNPIEGSVGSGDFSQISYEKAFGTQMLSRGGSGRGEIQIHTDSGGVENTTLWGSEDGDTYPADTDVPFTVELDPDAETASLSVNGATVTDDDITDGDANGDSTGDTEYPSGVPSEVDIAVTAVSRTSSVTTVVKDLSVNGQAVQPGSISAQDDLTHVDLTGVSATSTVTIEGTLRFEGSTSDFDGRTNVGVDFR